ncbi:hypothetical protein AAFF_G00166430 [Aldrovandia affinis]|uniref:Uncharacterized protein n=1 Tax=Aldrovandia affinis TaxID=143900 RepID=A0AAD7W836_9TELE|nr:hypothetical protein AAFF_G00166430 [Aldrovandia affinis]
MLCRDILLLCSLAVFLVKADHNLDSDWNSHAISDQDSTSDDAPTESINSIPSDQHNDASSTSSEADHGDLSSHGSNDNQDDDTSSESEGKR